MTFTDENTHSKKKNRSTNDHLSSLVDRNSPRSDMNRPATSNTNSQQQQQAGSNPPYTFKVCRKFFFQKSQFD